MHEYYFTNEDYLPHEADIVMSGCVDNFQFPKRYFKDNLNYWLYSSNFTTLYDEINNQDYEIQIKDVICSANDYMLRPSNIVFHPERIQVDDGKLRFQYLPQKEKPLYCHQDLRMWIKESYNTKMDKNEYKKKDRAKTFLYFKHEERLEEICFNEYSVCKGSKCNIFADYNGKSLISSDGSFKVIEGTVDVNGITQTERSKKMILEKGDIIKFGSSLAIFW